MIASGETPDQFFAPCCNATIWGDGRHDRGRTAFWTCTGGYGGYGGQSCDSRLKRRPLSFVSGWKGRSTLAGISLIILTVNMFLHSLASCDGGKLEDKTSEIQLLTSKTFGI